MFALVETPSATTLKLAYFEEMQSRSRPTGIDVQPGVNYITLNYTEDGFNNVIKRIDSAGIQKTGWVKRDNYQLFFLQDPDGVFVEIVGPPEQ